jgi:hypothetical protein
MKKRKMIDALNTWRSQAKNVPLGKRIIFGGKKCIKICNKSFQKPQHDVG